MKSTLLLLSLFCALGQSDGGEWLLTPQLDVGRELVYSGTCTEESLLPGVQYKRIYRLDHQVLVLASNIQSHDVAIMTSLSAREPGEQPKFTAVSVKLEVARIDAQGRLKVTGNASIPVNSSSLLEAGCFVEAPATRVGKSSAWEAADEGRPPRSWVVLGGEMCDGQMCAKLMGEQKSDDWDQARADRTAWRRRDIVWMSVQMGVAVKVERTLERRDPARREPSHRTVTEYSVASRLTILGKLFDDRKHEVLQAKRFDDAAGPILKQPAQNTPQIDALLRKISFHLENSPPTPYRKVVTNLAQRIDSARRGELLLAEFTVEEPVTPIGPLRVGQKVPDTVLTDLISQKTAKLNRLLGRPILIVYYNPQTKIGPQVLQFAKGIAEKMGDRVAIMAMAVTAEHDFAKQQHTELRLPFPIYEGSALRLAFAVDTTPRFIVLDADGYLRATMTGWAPQIGDELIDEIGRAGARPAATP